MNEFYKDSRKIEPKVTAERLILVDENDCEIGTEEKLKTHLEGKLHRAFSIFVFDDSQRLLLQKRAAAKYHSGGLWSNTCCGHPRPGEETLAAARRRLGEEMNFQCPLKEFFAFRYQTKLENNLIENEFDHVFIGKFNGVPKPEASEVEDWRWMDFDELKQDLLRRPDEYTYWLRTALEKTEWQARGAFLDSF